MKKDEEDFKDKILSAVIKIAESKIPSNVEHKGDWMNGFVKGYLERIIEEIHRNKLKN